MHTVTISGTGGPKFKKKEQAKVAGWVWREESEEKYFGV